MLVHAFITAHIDHCISLLYGLPGSRLSIIQQNSVVGIVGRYAPLTPVLYSLHWLPVSFGVDLIIRCT